MSGRKSISGPQKYNKVNQQKKFHLLTLIFKDKKSIREAAQIVGINYLTAKTVVFFHKNNYKSYQFDILKGQSNTGNFKIRSTASYMSLKRITSINEKLFKPKTRIQVICSIGNVLSPPVQSQNNGVDENNSKISFSQIIKNQFILVEKMIPEFLVMQNKILDFCHAGGKDLSGKQNKNSGNSKILTNSSSSIQQPEVQQSSKQRIFQERY